MGEIKQILNHWSFKALDESDWMTAKVPGCVHTDLLTNGVIPDPFYGTNEKKLQWIDKKDWEYETTFDITDELMSLPRLELVFDGLDTYADVYLNGKHILAANNMFRTWKVDIKAAAQHKDNRLHIRFRSPIQEDLPKLEKLGYPLPATNDQSEVGELGDKKLSVFARKAPYHYGWDWGPRFVTSGIWREVRIEGWSGCRITDLFIQQVEISSSSAKLKAIVEIESEKEEKASFKLSTKGHVWERPVELSGGIHTIELEVEISDPELWWCNGLGEPHLYSFTGELIQETAAAASRTVKTGLRSIKLVQEKDTYGASFYFELNGVAVFAKGANHIPNDSFTTEVTADRYRYEIATAVESNMNMLRVWGGGLYEEKIFYELCDEHGLLVWQDFMFACSMFPGDEAFMDNIRLEAEENVQRLRNHPSVVLWCGNNEIDTAWSQYEENAGWGWKQNYSEEIREKLWNDYHKIFHQILADAVDQYAPGISYWPSSPMYGLTGDEKQHATNTSAAGDIHYWGVWHGGDPFEDYNINIGRFMSEYGFQSFPEYKSVRTYAEEEDMELESEVMLAHQKNGAGNRLIKQYMDKGMKEPKDFASFLYMSQVQQGEAMKSAIEAHRRRKPYCMGTLYWQLNDCWPVASWAGLDYYGRWKALQYYAKRSFQSVMLSIDGTMGGHTEIYIVSDRLTPINGTLSVSLHTTSGKLIYEKLHPVFMGTNMSGKVLSLPNKALLQDHDPSKLVMLARLEEDGQWVDSKEHYFVRSKELQLENPSIEVKKTLDSDGVHFTLETDKLAKQVWISAETEGIFTDNFFDLIPGHPKTVQFLARSSEHSEHYRSSQLSEASRPSGEPSQQSRSSSEPSQPSRSSSQPYRSSSEQVFTPADPGQLEIRSMIDFVK